MFAADYDAFAHAVPVTTAFSDIAGTHGLKEALMWRDEPYGESSIG